MQNPCLDGLTSWLCFGTEKSLCLVVGDVLPEALRGERGAARQSFGGVPDMWMIEGSSSGSVGGCKDGA